MRKINIVGLTVLIIVTEDYTWVYRGKVTKVKKPKQADKNKKPSEVRELI